MAKTEEIKVIISADSGKLTRELTSAEKAVLKAKGIVQGASGGISGSSKAWASYRNAAVTEMNKAMEGVRKAQEKVRQIREKAQTVTTPNVDMQQYIAASRQMGANDVDIRAMIADMQRPSPELQAQYDAATAELDRYKKAAQEAGQSVEYLNQKVEESSRAETAQVQAAKDAAARAKEQAKAARESASAHAKGARSASAFGAGLGKIGKTAGLAMIGVATLYALMRKLITTTLEAAKTDTQLSTSLGQIKGNLGVAFQAVYQAALPALRALANILATVTNVLAQFLSMLFRTPWGVASKGAQDYAKSVGGAGSAAKKAAQNMMAIDELNVVQAENDNSGGGGSSATAPIFTPPVGLSEFWNQFFADSKYALEEIKGLWDAIKESAKEAWDDKKTKFLGTIQTITSNVLVIVGNIAKAWKDAWQKDEAGQRIFSGILGTWAEILGIIAEVTDAIRGWSETADFSPITGSLAYLFEAVERIYGAIRDALKPIWEAFFGPTMDLSIDALGFFVNWLGMGIDVISILVSAIGILVQAVSSGFTFIKNVLNGQDVASAWATFKGDFLDGFDTNWNNIKEAWSGIGQGAVGMFGEGIRFGKPAVTAAVDEVASDMDARLLEKASRAKQTGTDFGTNFANGIGAASPAAQAAVTASTDAITEALANTPTTDAATQLGLDLMTAFSASITENQSLVTEAFAKISTIIAESLNGMIGNSLEVGREGIRQKFTLYGTDCGIYFVDAIEAAILTFTSGVAYATAELMSDAKISLTEVGSSVGSAFDAAKATVKNAVDEINRYIDSIPRSIDIVATVTFKVGGFPRFAGGGIIQMARGGIVRAASGGLYNGGQLIQARESGPELIGNLGGGKTAIMNNDQIVESVSNGVYKAMIEALGTMQGNDGGDTVLYLDGRELARALRKAGRSIGYQMSGNPSFAR